LTPLREGRARLHPIEQSEFGPVAGLRILHLQCHFGRDTLTLAQQGAREVVGLDFSGPAIAAARELAAELRLADRARFVEADVYDARSAIPEEASFDRVFVTWGAICWLPDIREWARVAASFLRPGGALYLAEGHPAAMVFDDASRLPSGLPGYLVPYFLNAPLVTDDPTDYADETVVLKSARTATWSHTLSDIVTAIVDSGLTLSWLHEHDAVPWKMFEILKRDADGMYGWPAERWLPLGFSLEAKRLPT
jgi:SAM-dependent methyltransferase